MSEKPRTGTVTYLRDTRGRWALAPGARCVVCKKPRPAEYPDVPLCRACFKRWLAWEIDVVPTTRTQTWEIRKVRS